MLADNDPDDEPVNPHLSLEQELVRMIAIRAVNMVADILDIFEDEETTGYFVLAAAVSGAAMHRCTFGREKHTEKKLAKFMDAVRECLADCREQAEAIRKEAKNAE